MKATIQIELGHTDDELIKQIFGALSDRPDVDVAVSDERDQTDTDDEESTDDRPDAADSDDELDATLRPGTWKFKVASALYHLEDRWVSGADMKDTLDGTEWERENPYRELSSLVDAGIASREKVEMDTGHDRYEYTLTPAGARLVKDTEAPDGVETFADVADNGGLNALFDNVDHEENETSA